jgi:hypothetical protein
MSDKPDLFNLYAAEVLGFPPGWRWFSLNSDSRKVPEGLVRVEGAVSAKKWKERDRATERMFMANVAEVREWFKRRAASEGKCDRCWGTGQEVASIHVKHGATYRTCSACEGTGKPRAEATA